MIARAGRRDAALPTPDGRIRPTGPPAENAGHIRHPASRRYYVGSAADRPRPDFSPLPCPEGGLMARQLVPLIAIALLLGSCARQSPPPPVVSVPGKPISFLNDVKPVLDTRCVACHSCYNAACQLKLSSFDGVDRGGSKDAVYTAGRLTDQAPTRLFFDAQTTDEWRAKGFHSVTQSPGEGLDNETIMAYFLSAKHRDPVRGVACLSGSPRCPMTTTRCC
jgi:hypothetical protein